jgi:predicted dehydrogenase
MSVRMGVVGTGRMAGAMLDAARHVPGLTTCAVASASGATDRATRFSKAFGIADAYGEVELLLKRDDIDLVYIATDTISHADLSVAALDAGKSVLCEKPFATSVGEAMAVADAARRNERLFVEAIWTLLLPSYQAVLESARSHVIGAPTHLVASFGYPVLEVGSSAAKDGVLLDRAIYPVSLAIKLLGPVERLDAAVMVNGDGVDVEASIQAVHKAGGCSQISASLKSLLSNDAHLSGHLGSMTLEAPLLGSEHVTTRYAKDEASGRAMTGVAPSRGLRETMRAVPVLRSLHRTLAGGRRRSHAYGANQYLPLLKHVVGLVASGKIESEVVPLDLSLEVARVLEHARRASSGTSAAIEGMQ